MKIEAFVRRQGSSKEARFCHDIVYYSIHVYLFDYFRVTNSLLCGNGNNWNSIPRYFVLPVLRGFYWNNKKFEVCSQRTRTVIKIRRWLHNERKTIKGSSEIIYENRIVQVPNWKISRTNNQKFVVDNDNKAGISFGVWSIVDRLTQKSISNKIDRIMTKNSNCRPKRSSINYRNPLLTYRSVTLTRRYHYADEMVLIFFSPRLSQLH